MSGPMPELDSSALKSSRDGDVAADPVGQLARPVPADGARDVALLVGGRVDVDLDEADVRVVQVRLRPVAVDEGVVVGVSVVGHGGSLLVGDRPVAVARGRGSRLGRAQPPDVGRSRRLNSASRSVQEAAARCAWRTIQGSTRLESSMVSVGPSGPSSTTIPELLR